MTVHFFTGTDPTPRLSRCVCSRYNYSSRQYPALKTVLLNSIFNILTGSISKRTAMSNRLCRTRRSLTTSIKNQGAHILPINRLVLINISLCVIAPLGLNQKAIQLRVPPMVVAVINGSDTANSPVILPSFNSEAKR
jgi:hypothetical protein